MLETNFLGTAADPFQACHKAMPDQFDTVVWDPRDLKVTEGVPVEDV